MFGRDGICGIGDDEDADEEDVDDDGVDDEGKKRWNNVGVALYTLESISFDSFISRAIWRLIVELRGPLSCWTALKNQFLE